MSKEIDLGRVVGEDGRSSIVLVNGNWGNWAEDTRGYVDSGVKAEANVDLDNQTIEFAEAAGTSNISSGEKLSGWGAKLSAWWTQKISKLKALAFKDKADWNSDIENKPTSMPASDVSAWAKAALKPGYDYSEITGKPVISQYATPGSLAQYTDKGTLKIVNAVENNESVSLGQMEQRFEGSQLIVATRPTIGQAGVFYLVPTETENVYAKWMWILVSGVWGWKEIGKTAIDLSDYAKMSIIKTTTLAVASWVNDTANSGYYKCTIADAAITSTTARIEFVPASSADRTLMQDSGVIDLGEEATGSFIIYAESLPASNINIKYIIQQ